MSDGLLAELQDRLRDAAADGQPLRIQGGGSKAWYGCPTPGATLAVGHYRGVVDYEPTELVVTVRAGTPLAELETVLAEQGQMLACESPQLGGDATVGGTLATALAGPRRPYAGAVRDQVLGVSLLDGRGELLRFGGRVMKNVAGFDVSRLMVGSLGSLGVIVEASLKLLPKPAAELTLRFDVEQGEALRQMNRWAGEALPLSASCWHRGHLWLRLSGNGSAVEAARRRLGGEAVPHGAAMWQALREFDHPAQQLPDDPDAVLWRASLPSITPPLLSDHEQLIEWSGAQRWFTAPAYLEPELRRTVAAAGGHLVRFRALQRSAHVFDSLPPAMLALQQRLKARFDPAGILNPGAHYESL